MGVNTPAAPLEIRDRIKELRRVPAAELRANPRNWRKHPKAQRAAMLGILAEIGYADALLARDTDNGLELIDGHLRAETTPDLVVPVLILDVSAEEADLIMLTHDPIAAMADADKDTLSALLDEVSVTDEAVAAMLAALAQDARIALPVREGLTEADAIPEDVEPVSRPGDLWLLGGHRLLCGDSTDAGDVARLMDGALASMMWTDPPYGVSYVGGTKDALTIENDSSEGLERLLHAAFATAEVALEQGSPFYIARPAGALSVTFGNVVLGLKWMFHEELQWVKDSLVLGHSDYHLRHETLIYGWLPGFGRPGRGKHEGSRWYGNNAQTSVIEIPRPKASPDHPTAKPVELVARCIGNSSLPGALVYEPFSGSGSTLIACERLLRRCRAMEIDPRYVDVAVRRWEQYTGQKAVLDGS